MKTVKIFLALLLILISGFFIYGVHYSYSGIIQDPHSNPVFLNVTNLNYPFPVHADEWTHLGQIIYIINSKTLGFVNPYSPSLTNNNELEVGFNLFLALFFIITTLNPVLSYQFLPAIFFMINATLLFFFVKKLTKNYYIALFSILFFLAIPSNINFLGNWFAVPLTFSIFSIYLFFICLIDFIETKKEKISCRYNYFLCSFIMLSCSNCIHNSNRIFLYHFRKRYLQQIKKI